MIDNSNSTPINKMASRVTSRGFDYKPEKRIVQVCEHAPIPYVKIDARKRRLLSKNPEFIDLSGHRRGRLTALGPQEGGSGKWVCRCDCGRYVLRKAKSIKNPRNEQDRCDECRHVAYLKRKELYWRTGKDLPMSEF